MKMIMRFLKDYKKECVLAPLFKMLEAIFELFVPLVVSSVIDKGIVNADKGYIMQMCFMLILLAIIGLVCAITAQYFSAKAAVGAATGMRHSLFAHIQTFSFTEMDTLGTSTLVTRMTSDINQVQNGINMVLRLFLRSPFIVFGAMIMAFTIDVKAALVFVAAIPVLALIVFGIMLATRPMYKNVQSGLDKILGITRENLTGVRVIRAFNKEQDEVKRFKNDNESLNRLQKFVGKISGLMNPLTYVVVNVSIIALIWIGGVRVNAGALTSLKGSNRYSGGLCNYPDGSRYFEYILSSTLGWSKSVDEYDKLVDSYLKKYMLKMQSLALKDSSILDKFDTFSFNMTDPVGILTDLKKRITDDFPEIPDVNYNIKYVSKALEDYTSPAMYFIPQLDNLDVNSIYINSSGTSASELYPTLAHEGYPGHMYQTQYFAATNPDWIRYILAPGGYVEGWASYVEVLSYNYAQTGNDALNKMYAANYATVLCLYAKGDIGVNYYGWSEDDVYRFISQYGFDDKSVAHEMYYAFVSDPGNYCKYVLGMLGFEQLKTKAQSELSDKFNLKNFHQYILDMGPVQFDILFNNLDAWIKKEK